MNPRSFGFRAASVLVCGCSIGLLALTRCGAPNSGGRDNVDDVPEPFPMLRGCPDLEPAVVDEPFTITISVSDATLLGVAPHSTGIGADVVATRIDDQSFTAIVTPTKEGDGTVNFVIEFSQQIDLSTTGTSLSCRFRAIADRGACCEAISCEVTDSNECFFRDGEYKGAGTTCTDNPCVGACCELGTCSDALLESECAQMAGDYQGGGSLCVDSTCEAPLTGACCLPDGTCAESASELACESFGAGSTFQGLGTSCLGAICSVTEGRCCLQSGECVITGNREACDALTGLAGVSSTWVDAGTECIGRLGDVACGPPLRGACCFSFGRCEGATPERCELLEEGVFIGMLISCSDFERLPASCITNR